MLGAAVRGLLVVFVEGVEVGFFSLDVADNALAEVVEGNRVVAGTEAVDRFVSKCVFQMQIVYVAEAVNFISIDSPNVREEN